MIKKLNKKIPKKLLEKAGKPILTVRKEFKNQVSGAVIGAFGFIIALAWKDLILKIIESVTPKETIIKYPYLNQLFSATIITFFSVIGIILISRWAKGNEEK